MRIPIALALGLVVAGPATAETAGVSEAQRGVLDCIEAMGQTTVWDQCASLMFGPCAAEQVGSDGHVACLSVQHEGWQSALAGERTALIARLTSAGSSELTQLMGQWFGYVAQKCAAVAASKPAEHAEAAQLGCEISEIAGVTTEFVACREGRSTAPYCVLQE
ncbi:MAG: hypothetical protein LJE68_11045 [Rhodobacter sp.]|jgi:hypothetical protein|nr:hypothetical protein [Rhodobacter sp.]